MKTTTSLNCEFCGADIEDDRSNYIQDQRACDICYEEIVNKGHCGVD